MSEWSSAESRSESISNPSAWCWLRAASASTCVAVEWPPLTQTQRTQVEIIAEIFDPKHPDLLEPLLRFFPLGEVPRV